MSISAEIALKSCIEQAYAAAHLYHGDLNYALEAFGKPRFLFTNSSKSEIVAHIVIALSGRA